MLPDYLAKDLVVVFCGTAAGKHSANTGHYYSGRGNRFWPLLAQIGLTPFVLKPEQDGELTTYRMGLTDLAKGISGMDHEIPQSAFLSERVTAVVDRFSPRSIAFNGLKAARVVCGKDVQYGRIPKHRFCGTEVWVLPSTSGAARGSFFVGPWLEMADWIREVTSS